MTPRGKGQERMGKARGNDGCRVAYVEIRSYRRGDYNFTILKSIFCLGNSSKECVVGVLPGKNIV